jgi:hypothetical protein
MIGKDSERVTRGVRRHQRYLDGRRVQKTPLLEPFLHEKRPFDHDRLGTNIGKVEKEWMRFS